MRAIPRRRQPTTPGEILREEFLIPLGMTQKQLADHLACDVKVWACPDSVDTRVKLLVVSVHAAARMQRD